MKKIVFACAAFAMTGIVTAAASAPAFAETNQVVIETAAYDLGSAAGHDALAGRIRRAGSAVCGPDDVRMTRGVHAFRSCRTAAIADGMSQLDALGRRATVTIGASR